MRYSYLTRLTCLTLALAAAAAADDLVLARIDEARDITALGVPVYEHLVDGNGIAYILTIQPRAALDACGRPYAVILTAPRADDLALAAMRRVDACQRLHRDPAVSYDDGCRVLIRRADVERFAAAGFAIKALATEPMAFTQPALIARRAPTVLLDPTVMPNAAVAAMMQAVALSNVYDLTAQLSGETNIVIGTNVYTLLSRHTRYGSPFLKDSEFVAAILSNWGYTPSYFWWTNNWYTNRNVIVTLPGSTKSNELVLMTAHLDDTSQLISRAPGADDNASGCVALLLAAQLLRNHTFARSVRFAFFTGEEQGLYGSAYYAVALTSQPYAVAALYNFDMIAWDAVGGPALNLYTRLPSHPQYADDMAVATLFTNLVVAYGMQTSLWPAIISNGESASDHASFWQRGYPAILAIEQYPDDFNAYYHTTNDRVQNVNMTYYTAFVKAAVGSMAHAGIIVPEPAGLAALAMLWLVHRRPSHTSMHTYQLLP
jgi:hypothetical protein